MLAAWWIAPKALAVHCRAIARPNNVTAAHMPCFVVVFTERAHKGCMIVGPFDTREEAHTWASFDTAGGTAEWKVQELEVP
jgi:hypothetical protein